MAQSAARKQHVEPEGAAERRILAEKIERVTALRDRLAKIRKQIEDNPPYIALGEKDRVEEALRRAREAEGERVTAKILGEPLPEGPSVEEAQRALDQASTRYEAAKKAEKILQDSEAEIMRSLHFAETALHDAIAAVARPVVVAGLIEKLEVAQREVAQLRLSLGTVWSFLDRDQRRMLDTIRQLPNVAPDPAWAAWIAALATNADAIAPVIK